MASKENLVLYVMWLILYGLNTLSIGFVDKILGQIGSIITTVLMIVFVGSIILTYPI